MQVAGCAAAVGAAGCALGGRKCLEAQARSHGATPLPKKGHGDMQSWLAGSSRDCGAQIKQEKTPDQISPFTKQHVQGAPRGTQPVRAQKSSGATVTPRGVPECSDRKISLASCLQAKKG